MTQPHDTDSIRTSELLPEMQISSPAAMATPSALTQNYRDVSRVVENLKKKLSDNIGMCLDGITTHYEQEVIQLRMRVAQLQAAVNKEKLKAERLGDECCTYRERAVKAESMLAHKTSETENLQSKGTAAD